MIKQLFCRFLCYILQLPSGCGMGLGTLVDFHSAIALCGEWNFICCSHFGCEITNIFCVKMLPCGTAKLCDAYA